MTEIPNEADIILEQESYTIEELAKICNISIQGMHQYIKKNKEKINVGKMHIRKEDRKTIIDREGAAIIYKLRQQSNMTKNQMDNDIYEKVFEAEVVEEDPDEKTVVVAVEELSENMKSQLMVLNNSFNEIKSKYETLKDENKELFNQNTALQVENAKLTKDLEHQEEMQKRDLADKDKEISGIQSELDFAKSQINTYKEKAENIEKEKSTLNKSFEDLTKEKDQLQQQNTILSSDKNRNTSIWIAAIILSVIFACGLGYMLGYVTK